MRKMFENHRFWLVRMTSMLSHVWITEGKDWHGLSGVILTCIGTKQHFGLVIFHKMEMSTSNLVLLVMIKLQSLQLSLDGLRKGNYFSLQIETMGSRISINGMNLIMKSVLIILWLLNLLDHYGCLESVHMILSIAMSRKILLFAATGIIGSLTLVL